MGEMITIPSDAAAYAGYLSGAAGPGVIVIADGWSLAPHIVDLTDRFGDAGFIALAPELYAGRTTGEPEAAAEPVVEPDVTTAFGELAAAVDVVVAQASNPRVGVVGYGLGGGVALMLAARLPAAVKAVAPYYAVMPWPDVTPEWSNIDAVIVGEYTALDEDGSRPHPAHELQAMLRALGKDATLHVHVGAQPGFFDDSRPEVYDAEHALEAWERTLQLFRDELVTRD